MTGPIKVCPTFEWFGLQWLVPADSLFFILGHISGGRVTVTDGELQDIFTIMNMSLLNG
jgi:hypothetical protein